MFSSLMRLKKGDFDLIKNLPSKKFFSKNFSLQLIQSNFKPIRFGVVINTRVSKKSVVRNKLKRRIKAVILNAPDKFKNNFAVIINVSKSATGLSFEEIKNELLDLLKKTGVSK